MSTLSSFVYRAELHFASKDSWDALTALTLQVGYVSREAREWETVTPETLHGVAEETYNLLRLAGYTAQQIDKELVVRHRVNEESSERQPTEMTFRHAFHELLHLASCVFSVTLDDPADLLLPTGVRVICFVLDWERVLES
jgi:hypothetical protein